MEHEAEPGRTEAAGQDAAGKDTGPDAADGVVADAVVADAVVADDAASDGTAPDRAVGDTRAEQTTGEPRVDAALKLLDRLPGLPVSDHPELFEQVHARLSEVLDELESGHGVAGPAGG
jgi:hypothetical protein